MQARRPQGERGGHPQTYAIPFMHCLHQMLEDCAPVAQLDRALVYETKGWRFESSRGYQVCGGWSHCRCRLRATEVTDRLIPPEQIEMS